MSKYRLSDDDRRILLASRVLLSFSGGKDSTACALILEENEIPFDLVFLDTGFEHPAVLDYIKQEIEPRFGTVRVLKSERFPGGMIEAIERKGIFPSRRIRYCTDELKIKPWRKFLKSIDEPCVSVLGIRREESKARAGARRWGYDPKTDSDVFKPLVEFSFEDVVNIHKEKNMAPNPLYLQGVERVGCFPCIFARKSEIELMGRIWPERVDQIADLERRLTLRRSKKEAGPVHPASFFGDRSSAVGAEDIKTVVEWSRTVRGGRQLALFNESASSGCMRWGFCESPMADPSFVTVAEAQP